GDFGDCLYTSDWARGIVYRHELKEDGASFFPNQINFVTDMFPTHVDVDGRSRIYASDWARRDWSTSAPIGAVYLVRAGSAPTTAPSTAPTTAPAEPFPDLRLMTLADLVTQLSHPSAVRRREVQQELLHRRNSKELDAMLKTAIADKKT